MSRTAIPRYRWTCDGCGRAADAESLPADWVQRSYEVGPCGLTNYYRTVTHDLCAVCVREPPDDAAAPNT